MVQHVLNTSWVYEELPEDSLESEYLGMSAVGTSGKGGKVLKNL